MKNKILGSLLIVGIVMVSAGNAAADGPQPWGESEAGAVYTMTNSPDGNTVVIFDRAEDGLLTKTDSVSTGGKGSGGGLDPLASQNSLVLSSDKRWLLAVNAGSNDISVFRVLPNGLKWVDKVDSGGVFPVGLTVHHDLVYVLNAGGSPNIAGFTLNHKGRLTPLAFSTRSLGSGAFTQVGFDPEGGVLVVADRAGSTIFVYSVSDGGLPAATPVVSASNGSTPFGFIFDRRGRLLVVEVGPNAVSSYEILPDGTLQVISGSVPNGQRAACWIAGDGQGGVFTANPGSGTISAYHLSARDGQVALLDGAAGGANKPLDLGVSTDGRFLYALDPGNGGIDMFRIQHDGSLINLGSMDGTLPLFAQGIAAR